MVYLGIVWANVLARCVAIFGASMARAATDLFVVAQDWFLVLSPFASVLERRRDGSVERSSIQLGRWRERC